MIPNYLNPAKWRMKTDFIIAYITNVFKNAKSFGATTMRVVHTFGTIFGAVPPDGLKSTESAG